MVTRSEVQAESVARKFFSAVEALENFQDDPEMVYDELYRYARLAPTKKIRESLTEVANLLSGSNMSMED